jgi:hypothetical protein
VAKNGKGALKMGRCSTKIKNRKYNSKSCGLCGNGFTPNHPAKKYCCEECRKIARERQKKRLNKKHNVRYNNSKRRMHFCDICGKPLNDGRQHVHFSCMVKKLRQGSPGSWTKKEKRYFQNRGFSSLEVNALAKGEMTV